MTGRRSLAAIGTFAALLFAAGPAWSDKVETRAWPHAEFGRMVFEWPAAVGFTATADGDKLVIAFDRPIETSLSNVAAAMGNRVTDLTIGDAGRSVTGRMIVPGTVRSFATGTKIIVDVVPSVSSRANAVSPSANDAPANGAVPVPSSSDAPAIPNLSVRVGEHPGFGRLVFDWRSNVDYRVAKNGGTVAVKFDLAASVDLGALTKELPDQIKSVSAGGAGRGLELEFAVDDGARVRHFRDGMRVVVDILAASGGATSRSAPGAKATGAPRALTPPPAASIILPNLNAPTASNEPGQGTSGEPRRLIRSAAAGKNVPKVGPDGYVVSVDVGRESGALVMRFNWREPVSAAVFRRDGVVWAMFGQPSRMDLGGIRVLGRGMIEKAAQLKLDGATLIKLDVPSSVSAEMRREDTVWVMSLQPRRPSSLARAGIEPQVESGPPLGPRVLLPVPKPERIFRFRDPVVGDELIAIPLGAPDQNVVEMRKFVDFELLASAQGVAILPVSEGLDVSADKSGVLVTSPRGLMISRDQDRKERRRTAEARRPLSHIRDWRLGPADQKARIEARLIEAVVTADKAAKNDARVRLARFYVAYGRGSAAHGVLAVAARQDPEIERDLDFRAVRGAANFQLAHFGEAREDLTYSFLKDDRSVAPWLGAIAAAKGDWKEAERLFRDADWVLGTYPPRIANMLRAIGTEASLIADDLKTATARMTVLERGEGTADFAGEIDYLHGHMLKRQGNDRAALAVWDRLAANGSRQMRAKAAYSAAETRLERKDITPEQAIDRLEALTFAWRGGFFEFDLLRRLGGLYAETADLRDALHRYRKAATYFEDAQGVEAITGEMTRLFRDLFLDGRADELQPISALALYQEFRELTPVGDDGDEMIRKLADRLVKVDLLAEAAELLQHQVEHRLAGTEKARVGARLAVIQLLHRDAKAALNALDISKADELPAPLAEERTYLAAQAASEVGDVDGALAQLARLRTEKADEMRIDVYWRNKRWKDAAGVLSDLTAGVEVDGVDKTEAERVLRYAVALALDGDTAGLADLRRRIGTDMQNTDQAAAFSAIVGKSSSDFADFKTLATQAGGLDSFQAFMASYREKMKSSELSAIN